MNSANKPLTKEEIESYISGLKKYQTKENIGKDLDPKTVERIRYFAEHDDGKPFYMINLIKENKEVNYPDGWTGPKAKTVLEAKKLYSAVCLPFLQKHGSSSVFGVTFTYPAAYNNSDNPEDWDQFYLVRYASRKVFLELISSEFYAKAIVHKNAGDKSTVLIPVELTDIADYKNNDLYKSTEKPLSKEEVEYFIKRLETNLTKHPKTIQDFRYFMEHDDGKPIFMVNLVKEREALEYPPNWTGPKAKDFLEAKQMYTDACEPLMSKIGLDFVIDVTAAFPSAYNDSDSEEEFDQFYIVGYKSRRAYFEFLSSEEYAKAFIHKYAGDKYTALIPVAVPI